MQMVGCSAICVSFHRHNIQTPKLMLSDLDLFVLRSEETQMPLDCWCDWVDF